MLKTIVLATGLLISSLAHAQTPSTVTLYGRVDLNLTKISNSNQSLAMSQASTSRWGLRGSESLGGGNSAIFQLESRVNADDGTGESRLFGRESWLGLRGGWGTFRMGRSLSPSQRVASGYDPHGTDGIGSLGSTSLLLGHSPLVRLENALYYEAANLGGFTAFVAHQLDEVKDATDAKITTLRLRYANGPLDVSLAHGKLGGQNDITSLGMSYDFKAIKPMFQYHTGERNARDRRSWLFGATAPLGTGELRAAYSKLDDRGTNPVDRTLLAVGYDYPLSKRTLLYGTVARDKTQNQKALNGIELGMRHSF